MMKRLIWSALLMAVTAWFSPAQQTKSVSIPGDAYTAYSIPAGGSALQLNINRANNNLVIDDSEIQMQDSSDTVQWYRTSASQASHVYQIGTVLSAREYLHVFGHYHYTNGVGGGGTHPTFNAKVAAPDVDPEYLNEDQEESVGIWIGKSGVRKPITIRDVKCKGPGNQQILTWSSGKLSLWTASSGGTMLSGGSKYLSASQETTYYAQGDMASGSIRDSEINTAYTAGGNTAYDKLKITVVGASFTPFSIIPVNTTQDVSVTVSPNPPGTNITLQLSCLSGSGSAVFAPDGTTSTNITQSTTVKIKGVTASSVASNMILKAMLGNDMFASNKFTVVKVEIEKCSSAYLPKGGSEDNTTTIRAYATPDTFKGRFKFTLYDVSDEKGYCLNAPTNPPASGEDADAWKDFQFPVQTGFTISGADSNVAETVSNNIGEATVTIKSFDYGSFGKIKAEFISQDSSLTCYAKEVGGTNEYTRLPADTNGNCIADSWNGDIGPNGGFHATNDTDNLPTGKIGDGFTRYEEWRGFIVGGTHTRSSTTQRDLFVCDQDGIGIGYFLSGSGIQVHLIDEGEWTGIGKKADDKRIVNNNRETAASSKQYGLHIIDGGSPGGAWGYCWGDPDDNVDLGPPNACWKITVETADILATPTFTQEWVSRTIAHEMGHGAGVPHHDPSKYGGNLCVMLEYSPFTNQPSSVATSFCTTTDNCQEKIDVKDP